LPPPKFGHSSVAANIYDLLAPFAKKRGLGRALMEAGYKLSNNPPSWIQPDVSFLRRGRVESTNPTSYSMGAPDLAIEIVSPSESAKDLERKTEALLNAGARAVWVVYPDTQHVHVHTPDGTSSLRKAGQTLTIPELLPGFELPVSAIFED